jgi:hypothetical protein
MAIGPYSPRRPELCLIWIAHYLDNLLWLNGETGECQQCGCRYQP